MGSNTERARAALNAMKNLGFSKKFTAPILKTMLGLYGNKWELIEDENYRALIDAILDKQEKDSANKEVDDGMSSKMKEVVRDDEPDPLRTKQRSRQEDEPRHSTNSYGATGETPLKRPKLEPDSLPGERIQQTEVELKSPERALREKIIEPLSPQQEQAALAHVPQASHAPEAIVRPSPEAYRRETRALARARHGWRHTQPSSSLVALQRNKESGKRLANPVRFEEPNVEPGIETPDPHIDGLCASQIASFAQVGEPNKNDSLNLESSLAVICPNPIPVGNRDEADSMTIEHMDLVQGKDNAVTPRNSGPTTDLVNVEEASSRGINIASSSNGEVRISLTCNTEHSDFHMPSLDAVFKMVEDRCLRSYRILQPNFSLGNLMNEICQCVVELGSNPNGANQNPNVQVDPAVVSSIKCGISSSNGSILQKNSGVVTNNAPCLNPKSSGNDENVRDNNTERCPVVENSKTWQQNSIVLHQPHLALGQLRPTHDINDISKGEERVRIPVVNEFSSEKYPSSFNYIPRNLVYQSAHVNFSLARIGDEDCCSDCFGDCLSAPVPCPCARETGGEFAYTSDGLVKKEFLNECVFMNRDPQNHPHFYCKDCPLERFKNEGSPESCKGHLVRRFIKECWSKCGCNKQCGNRVVQRGISCNLQVFFTSEGKGWGVRTLDELPRGAFVCEYVGEVLTNTELDERRVQSSGNARHTYPVLLDADWGSEGVLKDEEALCLDATFYANVARFVNHRCYDANLVEIPVEVETPDHHYYHHAFFTSRKVEAFEELTWDYGIDFDDCDHPLKAFRCRCGSRYCRNIKRTRSRGKASASK